MLAPVSAFVIVHACAKRARTEGWPYRELATPHDPQVFDPAGIAALLEDLAVAELHR